MRRAVFRRGITSLISLTMLLGAAESQMPGAESPAFAVSTVKPAADSPYSNVGYSADSFTASNMTLRTVIEFAYELGSDHQLLGEPGWVDTARFDIRAKEEEAFREKMEAMPFDARIKLSRAIVQPLLADRFQLRVHHETRDLPVLVLVAAKSGPKFKLSKPDDPDDKSWKGLHNDGHGHVEGRQATMELLASHLGGQAEIGGQTIVDKTGLAGKYDFDLNWTPERRMDATNDAGPSLFTAIQEQLGLKLESAKAPVDVLVVDHVEMPSPN